MSPAAEKVLGYSPDDLEGRSFLDVIPEEWRCKARNDLKTGLDVGELDHEMALLDTSGQPHLFEDFASAIEQDGRIVGLRGILHDITERTRVEKELEVAFEDARRRDADLDAVAFAANRFLRADDWEHEIQTVLARLGEATDVSRAYVFQNHTGQDGRELTSLGYEWAAPGGTSRIENPLLKNCDMPADGLGRWQDVLSRGEILHGHARDFPLNERRLLEAQDVHSLTLIPVFVDKGWWGFIGFDECRAEREWSAGELDALKVAGDTLGAAVQRRASENLLRESENRLKTLADATFEAIFISENGVCLDANKAATRLFGYDASELVGMLGTDTIAPESRELVTRHMVGGYEGAYEATGLRKDGSTFPCEIRGRMLQQGVNAIRITAVRDVTEHKRAEETLLRWADELETRVTERTSELSTANQKLRWEITERERVDEALGKSEHKFRTIFDRAPLGVALINSHTGQFVEINREYCDIVGYTREEMLNLEFQTITHPDDLQVDLDNMGNLIEGKIRQFNMEKRYFRKDGFLIWVSLTVVPMWAEGAQPQTHIAMVEDITDRKRTEETLRASETRLRNAQRVARLGSWDWNIVTGDLYWSEEIYRIFGL